MLSEDGGSCCTQHISLTLAIGSWAELSSSPLLQNHQNLIPGGKNPKAQLCAFGGVSRSHKDHRRHQRAIDTQLLWGFVAADVEEYAQPWTAPLRPAVAEVADLPAVTWVALMVRREGESTGASLPSVQSCAGAGAVLFGPSEPPFKETAGLVQLQSLQSCAESPAKTPKAF